MRIAFFDTHQFEKPFFNEANKVYGFSVEFFEPRLTEQTVNLAVDHPVVCAFVNDRLGKKVLESLAAVGCRLIALRSAGFNNVDLEAAEHFGIRVVRVPEYSPYAVAEHAVALILALNRKIPKAYNRVKESNFSLNGLVGFDLHGKAVGVVGTGRIGGIFAKIMRGFGCKVLAYDREEDPSLKNQGVHYTSLNEVFSLSDIISLHVPLTPETHHLIDKDAMIKMKKGVMLINTGRGGLIETQALIHALKKGKIGFAGLDVYEEEEGVFFEDLSDQVLQDDSLARLLTFPNVIMTSHQAFLTEEALHNIAAVTLRNISEFTRDQPLSNEVCSKLHFRTANS